MNCRIFYCCNSSGDEVESESAVVMDRNKIVETATQVLREGGDFFGIIDEHDNTLQFALGAIHGEVLMDIPQLSEEGSFKKVIKISEVETVLLSLDGKIDHSAFPGMEFESWD